MNGEQLPARPAPAPTPINRSSEVPPKHKAWPGTPLAGLASGKADGFVLVYLALP